MNFFKEDKMVKEIRQTNLLENNLKAPFLQKIIKLYNQFLKRNLEQQLIKSLLKYIEEKGNIQRKLKVLSVWIQMFKQTKYDLSDILASKKVKVFNRNSTLKMKSFELSKNNLQDFILYEIFIPLYNYFMKLALNEDLYKHCIIGKIPDDQVFRRGTKIRFIWIFKIYNLIYLLIPILEACIKILDKFPQLLALLQISHLFYKDILTMNNFVIEALEQGSADNFMLMPYFDMLQFYESLTEQKGVIVKINSIFSGLLTHESQSPLKPRILNIDAQTEADIRTQAVRVKLISCSLKNPKKDHTVLVTQYNQQLKGQRQRYFSKNNLTQQQENRRKSNYENQFAIKYRLHEND